jgi:hypothetical protein
VESALDDPLKTVPKSVPEDWDDATSVVKALVAADSIAAEVAIGAVWVLVPPKIYWPPDDVLSCPTKSLKLDCACVMRVCRTVGDDSAPIKLSAKLCASDMMAVNAEFVADKRVPVDTLEAVRDVI